MPFDELFNDIYLLGIKEACKEAGAYCERVDEQLYDGSILNRIYEQITKADIIIADMTGKNANVFYEVGYAHAIGKKTILLTKKAQDIPFDLIHYPHIIYNNRIASLKDELIKRIKWHLGKPNDRVEEKLSLEIHNNGIDLSKNTTTFYGRLYSRVDNYWALDLDLSFYNNSASTLKQKDFTVGLILSDKYSRIYNLMDNRVSEIKMSDKTTLCMLPGFDILFPYAYASHKLTILFHTRGESEKILIRIFSSTGTKDFELNAAFKE